MSVSKCENSVVKISRFSQASTARVSDTMSSYTRLNNRCSQRPFGQCLRHYRYSPHTQPEKYKKDHGSCEMYKICSCGFPANAQMQQQPTRVPALPSKDTTRHTSFQNPNQPKHSNQTSSTKCLLIPMFVNLHTTSHPLSTPELVHAKLVSKGESPKPRPYASLNQDPQA